mmetsp:Transcript_46292/g.128690  ORF Transcript_46292/g.128690 Transcript_46292/m.128690 type:complete len:245 (+) Transcript_46292:1305-2039(+)
MFLVSMPNSATALPLVESAAKWLATAASSLRFSSSHFLAESALVIVSCVVNVLDAMRKSVDSALHSLSTSAMWLPSTLETKWTLRSRLQYGFSASVTITGPRSDPPMPRLTTSVIVLPVKPFHSPERTELTKISILPSTSFTSGITSAPSTRMGVLDWLRSATWRTARFSVLLIFSPLNMRAASPLMSAASKTFSKSAIVSSVMMFFEKSSRMSSNDVVNLVKRSPSFSKRSRICTSFIFSKCS